MLKAEPKALTVRAEHTATVSIESRGLRSTRRRWKMSTDLLGREFKVGDKVARGDAYSTSTAGVRIVTVTKIANNGKPHLSGGRNAVWYPERLLIVNGVPDV